MDDTAFSNAEAAPSPNGLYRLANGQILILPDADDLHLRICIVGHTGPAGYRGKQNHHGHNCFNALLGHIHTGRRDVL
jgi:hypothetical protein